MNLHTALTDSITLLAARRLAVSLCLASTIALVACGGGAGTDGSRLDNQGPGSDNGSSSSSSTASSQSSSSASSEQPEPEEPSDPEPEDPNDDGSDDSDAGGNDNPDDGSGNDDDSADSGNDDVIEDVLVEVSGTVVLEWQQPEVRENGDPIYDNELGGYEVRYREVSQEQFTSQIIDEWSVQFTEIHDLSGTYEFEIAAYDTNGLYSEFVNILPAQ
ncbi:fibronectin type III domain-containing protein [Marinimicrobium sp. C6131]|uniref:hypothetical protein n=1 Tax=Marinimicrobium sp. C6131 TaxID=3022676 RepID=UPI00223E7BCE|nr:hypothetical protein [Marinimicrobium sp. C6131]UZJ43906.1 fibronectin type III domain-containing protein [Marinimicrobium sp. C6131]